MVSRAHETRGQATVEFVALLPVMGLVVVALWQAILFGQAEWSAAGAARAAARARAIGADALAAARAAVPARLRDGLRVTPDGDGVRVAVAVPLVFTRRRLGSLHARAQLPPQR